MKSLNDYDSAKQVAALAKQGDTFVKVISGPKEGTIALVVQVVHKNYERHDFKLKCEGHRAFTMRGELLEYVANHFGGTQFVEDEQYQVSYRDHIGQELQEGHTIVFHRAGKNGIEMVTGTIRTIGKKGLYVQPFKIGHVEKHSNELIKVSKPDAALRIAKDVSDQFMMLKLSTM